MLTYKTIEVELKDKQATIWLNQPEYRNSLSPLMIDDLIKSIKWIDNNDEIMVIVIRGKGTSFCSGANINWMNDAGASDYKKNYSESKKLAACFSAVYRTNKVVINMVHGHALGGALGFIGAGDFTFALKTTVFGLPEVKLGLVPAVIAPYILTRVKQTVLKFKIYTGKSFSSEEALQMDLIDGVFNTIDEMEIKSNELIESISSVSPAALKEAKKLMRQLNNNIVNPQNSKETVRIITELKMSEEAKKRMSEFILSTGKKKNE